MSDFGVRGRRCAAVILAGWPPPGARVAGYIPDDERWGVRSVNGEPSPSTTSRVPSPWKGVYQAAGGKRPVRVDDRGSAEVTGKRDQAVA
jgi:hypothetical protein